MMTKIYCCNCGKEVEARLTNGREVYPHRKDLWELPFWKCDECGEFVGCHHKTNTPTKPLGVIPTSEIKKYRREIHKQLDPLWKSGKISRYKCYSILTDHLGRQYHTADLRTVEECILALTTVKRIASELSKKLRRLTRHD